MSPVEVGLVVQLVLLVVGLLAALAPAGVRSRGAGLACGAAVSSEPSPPSAATSSADRRASSIRFSTPR